MHEISIASSLAGRITGFFVLQSRLGEFSIIARSLTFMFSVRANMVVTCGQGWNCGPVVIIAITEKKVTVHSAINYFVKKKGLCLWHRAHVKSLILVLLGLSMASQKWNSVFFRLVCVRPVDSHTPGDERARSEKRPPLIGWFCNGITNLLEHWSHKFTVLLFVAVWLFLSKFEWALWALA